MMCFRIASILACMQARLLAEEEASLSAVKVKAKSKAKAPVLKPWEVSISTTNVMCAVAKLTELYLDA
jgi:hypothetical protein